MIQYYKNFKKIKVKGNYNSIIMKIIWDAVKLFDDSLNQPLLL